MVAVFIAVDCAERRQLLAPILRGASISFEVIVLCAVQGSTRFLEHVLRQLRERNLERCIVYNPYLTTEETLAVLPMGVLLNPSVNVLLECVQQKNVSEVAADLNDRLQQKLFGQTLPIRLYTAAAATKKTEGSRWISLQNTATESLAEKALPGQPVCVVCCSGNRASICFVRCGHQVVCEECAKQMRRHEMGRCPVCRAEISHIVRPIQTEVR